MRNRAQCRRTLSFNVRRAVHTLGLVQERMMRLGVLPKRHVRGKRGATVIISNKAMETGRHHYGCKDFPGVALEELKEGRVALRFSLDFARGELMGLWSSFTGGRYTLTPSVFEYMEYYRANIG
ncbi:Gp63-1 surface protease-like protein [Trypanosoma rangeli]|uniref:Gp63-1 surface protease-like protein n=1 Tax=Trypanosoma rangeli TaxID=5698 RepID=A0A422NIJ6_TRYRA|nr:Gp63-1 surface protease-like protein [Trypanosoma rangeli]RNF05214.1 Gp63-1 surface protease-like protein [Trypanosoma rangeli]|eukprot:RNF05214.1 Gp63-1 surface protease-like protein [Trypanosoma rangeli]